MLKEPGAIQARRELVTTCRFSRKLIDPAARQRFEKFQFPPGLAAPPSRGVMVTRHWEKQKNYLQISIGLTNTTMRIRLPILFFAVLAALPAVTWAAFKPIRVFAPQLTGIECLDNNICIDDVRRLPEAIALREEAIGFVNARLERIGQVPRFVFCSASECAKSFGFTNQAAYHVGTFGIVIGPRGWQPHIARHELIHHVQMENIGSFHAMLFTPTWFIEGMAYSVSKDPRRPLPEPLNGWRTQFESWYPSVGKQNLWAAARAL